MKCNCDTKVPTEYNTEVCISCGVETPLFQPCSSYNVGYKMTHCPFVFGYSRVKRFSNMLNQLLFPSGVPQDNLVVEFLFKNQKKIKSLASLKSLLCSAPVRDKRFNSLHFFSKEFNPLYTLPPNYGCLLTMKKNVTFCFEKIALTFQRNFQNRPFCNYNFLMRYLLTIFRFDYYLRYVKKLKCNRRRLEYQRLLESLGFPP